MQRQKSPALSHTANENLQIKCLFNSIPLNVWTASNRYNSKNQSGNGLLPAAKRIHKHSRALHARPSFIYTAGGCKLQLE